MLRLALRDAANHRGRFVPAAATVLITSLLASHLAVLLGSGEAERTGSSGSVVHGAGLMVGTHTPVSDEFDELVMRDAAATIAAATVYQGTAPVYGIEVTPNLPADAQCGPDQGLDPRSVNWENHPVRCVPAQVAHQGGSVTGTWLAYHSFAMPPEALRDSGFQGADVAAEALAEGAVVVGNAALLRPDGTVEVTVGDQRHRLPGHFLPGAEQAIVSPDTAAAIGATQQRLVGLILLPRREPLPWEAEQVVSLVARQHPLAWVTGGHAPYPWGNSAQLLPLGLCLALAAVATAISLGLSRTQTLRDLVTIQAVGAPPGFARRFTAAQGLLIAVTGAVPGLTLGIALGALQVAWRDKVYGGWIETVPLWQVQAGFLAAVVLAALFVAVLWGCVRVPLVRRRLE